MEQTATDIKTKLKSLSQEMTAIVWLYDGVKVYENLTDFLAEDVDIDKRLHHIRVFNEEQEYYIWRSREGGFDSRLRQDDVGVPYTDETVELNKNAIKTHKKATMRHYYTEDYSGYIDSRYVKLYDHEC